VNVKFVGDDLMTRLALAPAAAALIVSPLAALAGGKEKLLIGRRGESVIAMAIMAPTSLLHWATFQPSQMPLGALVVAPGEGLVELGASLMRSALRSALVISFTQMDPLAVARDTHQRMARSDDYINTAWIDIAGDFDTYWATRGKNLRQNMRKQRNRLAADGVRVEMKVWRDRTEMAGALERYGALESRGWKAEQGTAIRIDNAQGRFYHALFDAAARRGEAIVYEYLLDGRTVALNLCVHRGSTLVILKTTYDETVKPMSPAFLLQEDQLKSIFTSGEFRRVEYYGRVMEWHTRWTDLSRALFHVTLYRWALVKTLAERRRSKAVEPADTGVSLATESASS